MSEFLHDDDDADENDDAKAIAIHRRFSENSRAKNKLEALKRLYCSKGLVFLLW